MKKEDFLMALGRMQGLKNSFTGDAKDFADTTMAAFQAMSDDDKEHTVEEVIAKVEDIAANYVSKQDVENKIAEVRESILRMVRANGAGEQSKLTPEIAKQVANAILRSRSHAEAFAALDGVIAKNDLTGITYQGLVDYTLNIKQEDADDVFDALSVTPFTKWFYGELDGDNAEQIAKQWDKSQQKGITKDLQTLALNGKSIECKEVYKMQRIANSDLNAAEEAGQQVQLLASASGELRKSIKAAAVRAILIGDNVNSGNKKITSFETIGTKKATDVFTTVLNPEGAEVTLVDLLRTVKEVKTERKWLFITSALEVKLRKMMYAAGGTATIIGLEDMAKMIGVERVINKDYLANEEGLHAIVMSPDEYRVKIRKTNEVPFPEWKENAQYLLAEMDMAGAIHGIKSTAVLRAAQ